MGVDMEMFDFVVIGGGSAGYAAAATATRSGLKTVCIEGGDEVGGLCILRGCMPSKTLIESANRFLTLRRATQFGLSAGPIGFDSGAIIQRKRDLIASFARYREEQLTDGRFEFVRGRAEFTDSHHVKVKLLAGGEQQIEGKSFLISTGSVLNSIDLRGLNEVGFLDSNTGLDSERFPRSIVILGGGAVALEFAHFYNALGVEVTVVQRSNQVLKEADPDIAEALVTALRKRGVRVICGTKLLRVERTELGKSVWYEWNGEKQVVEAVEIFYALGRRPDVLELGLEKAGVGTDKQNAVAVNEMLQTSQPHIFAAGDVTGLYEIVHIAVQQGETAARNAQRLLNRQAPESIDYRLKMFAMFSEPQIAVVGITEREAAKQGLDIRVAKYPFDDHGKSIVRGEVEGFVKLIAYAKNGEIAGGAAIGPEASEIIHEIAVAMHFHSTAATLASIPHYHPTLSEIWAYPAEELAEVAERSR
ncbi:MAG: NAD(P)/FAD-dependent oxidoreductase [Verrucomicrobia bacterium]|nr:NAD(P)/FAD-dependent oxidoreductase [Verrucomicrobiota bacterium]